MRVARPAASLAAILPLAVPLLVFGAGSLATGEAPWAGWERNPLLADIIRLKTAADTGVALAVGGADRAPGAGTPRLATNASLRP